MEASFSPVWVGAEELPVVPVNQVAVQLGLAAGPAQTPDGIYVTFGVATPPLIVGDEATMLAQIAEMNGNLPIQATARVFLTPDRAVEFVGVLQTAIDALKESATAPSVQQ